MKNQQMKDDTKSSQKKNLAKHEQSAKDIKPAVQKKPVAEMEGKHSKKI